LPNRISERLVQKSQTRRRVGPFDEFREFGGGYTLQIGGANNNPCSAGAYRAEIGQSAHDCGETQISLSHESHYIRKNGSVL